MKKRLMLLLFAFFISACTAASPQAQVEPEPKTRVYDDNFMEVSLTIPVDWEVEDKMVTINIISDEGEIGISRNGAWGNLAEHVALLKERNSLVSLEEKSLTINGYDALYMVLPPGHGEEYEDKEYFIYADNWVFSLFTSVPELYDDLDTIAMSFEYLGREE